MRNGSWNRSALGVAAMLFGVVVPLPSSAAVLYVKHDGVGNADGTTWESAYSDLQPALSAALPGDEIWVAAGTYRPSARTEPDDPRSVTFNLPDAVAVYGGFAGTESFRDQRDPGVNETVLSADLAANDVTVQDLRDLLDEPSRSENAYHVVSANAVSQLTVLDSFTVKDGNATGVHEPFRYREAGAGIVIINAQPTIRDVVFIRNAAGAGGALFFRESSPSVLDCMVFGNFASVNGGGLAISGGFPILISCAFRENVADRRGGGVRVANVNQAAPIFVGCSFVGNRAPEGGGLWNSPSRTTLIDCAFVSNTATEPGFGLGGAVYNGWAATMRMTNCVLRGNQARYGGAIFNADAFLSATGCVFVGNTAAERGGGVYTEWCNVDLDLFLINCTLAGNRAGAGRGLANGTVFMTCQAASRYSAAAYILNSILANGDDDVWKADESLTFVSIGASLIDTDPRFVRAPDDGGDGWGDDPATATIDESANDDYGDLRLQPGSPAIDAGRFGGLSQWVPDDVDDLDGDGNLIERLSLDVAGDPRVRNCRIDIGAYEYQGFDLPGDIDCDGDVDLADFLRVSECFSGPNVPHARGCTTTDFDQDGDTDLADLILFQAAVTGAQ